MHGVLPLVTKRRNAARADPNSYSLFTHNYAEEKTNENKGVRNKNEEKTRLNQFLR